MNHKLSLLTGGAVVVALQALPDVARADVPRIAPPSGYGHYCSKTYSGGGWGLSIRPGTGESSDPCADLVGGTRKRSGMYSVSGENNVMVRCGGDLRLYRDRGEAPISQAFNEAQGKSSCVFIISPTKLPVFQRPWSTSTSPSFGRGFNYNLLREKGVNVDTFGQFPVKGHEDAHVVDRYGVQGCFEQGDGDHFADLAHEGYDWPMPEGRAIRAVAAGRVIGARDRDVRWAKCGGTDFQKEVYVEHRVGGGKEIYEEGFVTYYAHLKSYEDDLMDGDAHVSAGSVLGENGSTGCSTGPHLHFGVIRTTNLTGSRSKDVVLSTDEGGYGIADPSGYIDPFGWAAPSHIDPWAWMFLGKHAGLTDPGAFSINLWKSGEAPPIASESQSLQRLTDALLSRCAYGVTNDVKSGAACCAAQCGTCGGSGSSCGSRPGGGDNCCSGAILSEGVSCSGSTPPCVMP